MAGLYDEATIAALRSGVKQIFPALSLSAAAEVSLLNVSENATFLAHDPGTEERVVIRVHRPGYHAPEEIESELAWISDLRAHDVVPTPKPLQIAEGTHLARFSAKERTWIAAAFSYFDGDPPAQDDSLVNGFHKLGAINARLHLHARTWVRPEGFTRKSWVFETTVGDRPLWGDWRAAPGLTLDGINVLERVCAELKAVLDAYGQNESRFGLIHADLRLANLLDNGQRLAVIDFDDCGFGWFGYDFAAAVSFIETDPRMSDLQDAWVAGYRSVAHLPAEDEAMLPTFVMLRRLLLTAWIASHSETPEAAELLDQGYPMGTVTLGERFLAGKPLYPTGRNAPN